MIPFSFAALHQTLCSLHLTRCSRVKNVAALGTLTLLHTLVIDVAATVRSTDALHQLTRLTRLDGLDLNDTAAEQPHTASIQ